MVDAAAIEPHAHAVGARRTRCIRCRRTPRSPAPRNDRLADRAIARKRGGGARSKPSSSAFVAVARAGAAQRQPVAGDERAPVPAAEAAADIGRHAAEHGLDVEAALDRHVKHRAAGERADPHDLAASTAGCCACRRCARRSSRSTSGRISIGAWRADEATPHVVGIDLERRPDIGHFERAGVRGDCRPARWRRAGSPDRARRSPGCPGADGRAGRDPAPWSTGRVPGRAMPDSCRRSSGFADRRDRERAGGGARQQVSRIRAAKPA